MTVTLRADVYPAQFTVGTPGETDFRAQDRVRVIVVQGTSANPDRLIVFADGTPAPRVVYSQLVTSFQAPAQPQRLRELHSAAFNNYTATTLQDPPTPLSFSKTGGCGCGSRLKSFNPFPQIASLNAPA
jgi:hypothetical protein